MPAAAQSASARPGPAPRTNANGSASVIGADLSVTGNLESKGEVQVEGDVQGDIHAKRIIVGEQARITGALIADEIIVRGNVQGSIRGNAVTFQSSSRVEGDVFHKALAIEQGAYFEGKSRRSDDPDVRAACGQWCAPARRLIPASRSTRSGTEVGDGLDLHFQVGRCQRGHLHERTDGEVAAEHLATCAARPFPGS